MTHFICLEVCINDLLSGPTKRVTRSQAAKAGKETTANAKSSVSAKSTNKTTRTTTKDPTKAAPPKAATTSNKQGARKSYKTDNVTLTRGDASFAPASFQFSAPSQLKSFAFKPLTPNSAAKFLMGQSNVAFSPMSDRR